MKTYDIIIMGGGPAGMTAALYALRNNKTVLILEKENFGGQIALSPRLENYPTIESISGSEWADKLFTQITNLGAEFELEKIEGISKNNGLFTVKTNYNEYNCKAFIAANGVKPRPLGLVNEADLVGKGVSYCAVCDGPFYKDKEIYLIGDANTALQYALLLTNYCPKIHMLCLFDKLFGDEILIDRVKSNNKIDITFDTQVIKFNGEDSLKSIVVKNTKTEEEKTIKTDNVFVAIGQIPQNEVFADLLTLNKGFIVTNDLMETELDGLFAAGDTRAKLNKQVITACSDGATAALSAVRYINSHE